MRPVRKWLRRLSWRAAGCSAIGVRVETACWKGERGEAFRAAREYSARHHPFLDAVQVAVPAGRTAEEGAERHCEGLRQFCRNALSSRAAGALIRLELEGRS